MSKILKGKVVSCGKMAKTATVELETRRPHPLYKKIIKKHKKILADTSGVEVNQDDIVKIKETRPISKRKKFKILEVLK